MNGVLNEEQRQVLRQFVAGKVVFDFGSGDCILSEELLELGAKHVHAHDKHFPRRVDRDDLTQHETLFTHLLFDTRLFDMDVAFISWPPNNMSSDELAALATRAKTVIYLGSNFDGSACGSEKLFLVMHVCELLAYVPAPKNNLLIVGKELKSPRTLTPEEISGLTMSKGAPIFRWDMAHSEEVPANKQLILRKIPNARD
jgi:hypothetical protein